MLLTIKSSVKNAFHYATVAAVLLFCLSATYAEPLVRVAPDQAGMRAGHLKHIEPQVQHALEEGRFAGCVIAIGRHDSLVYLEAFGSRQVEPSEIAMTTDTLFDLASLTKPVATATSVMVLLERGEVRLRDKLVQHIPDLVGKGTADITVEQLLTHTAGYVPDNSIKDYEQGPVEAWSRLLALEPRTPPGTEFKYSDVGFELLGLMVERVSGKKLNDFAKEEIFAPLGMTETGYLPTGDLRTRAATNEQRDGRWMVGEVHDPRAYLLGGVAGHAGLFSTAEDLARYAQAMLRGGKRGEVRVLGSRTVQEMSRPRLLPGGTRRAAGWDSKSGYSRNRGELFSDRAFGHSGFTGTSMWIDPELDLFVILLSNRLHPDGEGGANDLAGRVGAIAASALTDG